MSHYDFDVRIAYADTDRMGVVYYANYLVLFERGRTELLRNLGIRYRDLEEKDRLFLPAAEATVEYLAPARYDDLIRVRTWISHVGGARIDFEYEISLAESGTLVARGRTRHAFVNLLWRPARIPPELRAKLRSHARHAE